MRLVQLNENLEIRREWKRNRKRFVTQIKLKTPEKVNNPGVEIDLISTPSNERGKGHASKAMAFLLQIADKYNAHVYLSPEALGQGMHGALDQASLEAWYAKFGFVPDTNNGLYWVKPPR